MPQLFSICVFPIKSLDGHKLTQATVLPSGALKHDRRYALVDSAGKFVNGKRTPLVHQIRTSYDEQLELVTLEFDGTQRTFSLEQERRELSAWCSEILELSCQLVEDTSVGFPDDTDAPGPTVISTESLETVAHWYLELSLGEARRRFRANLEIACTAPFWEDQLVNTESDYHTYRMGEALWQGHGVCQRCAVPTRDSLSGEITPKFAQQFLRRREDSLPGWSPTERFDHFYRLAINTRLVSRVGKGLIKVGDELLPGETPRLD